MVANGNPGNVGVCALKGSITEAGTVEQLTGVRVTIKGTDIFTYTDREGHFEFAQAPAGSVVLEFLLVSFEPEQVVLTTAPNTTNEVVVDLESR